MCFVYKTPSVLALGHKGFVCRNQSDLVSNLLYKIFIFTNEYEIHILIPTERKIYSMFDEQVLSKPLQTLSVDVYVTILRSLAKALTKSVCI